MLRGVLATTSYGRQVRVSLAAREVNQGIWYISGHGGDDLGIQTKVTGSILFSLPAWCFAVDWAPQVTLTFDNPIDLSTLAV